MSASRTNSLSDIFGHEGDHESNRDGDDGHQPAAPPDGDATANAVAVDNFDEIFGDSDSASKPSGSGDSSGLQGASSSPRPDTGAATSPDFDDIFGESNASVTPAGSGDREETTGSAESSTIAVDGEKGKASELSGNGTQEFLDFLYDGDRTAQQDGSGRGKGDAETERTDSSNKPADEPVATPAAAAPVAEPASSPGLESVSLASPDQPTDHKALLKSEQDPSAAPIVDDDKQGQQQGKVTPPLRPLPEDPPVALRELVFPSTPATEVLELVETEDVGYIRRLCVASGGFLPADLRSGVWGLLLGIGRTPDDAGFRKWREANRDAGGGETSDGSSKSVSPQLDSPLVSSAKASTGTIPNKLDLRNDSIALARRLCASDDGDIAVAEPAGIGNTRTDTDALAVDIEEVLTFYCTRRSEAYEPVLSALVGPLFSLGLDAPAVSAMLHPLVGALTLFLGRGLTHAVMDLAWAHAHRRLHDLCTYHDPQLVQHLDRCFPGWEMPLPAASVSRAETSAQDQQAAAMVDDLESSLPGSRRRSASRAKPPDKATLMGAEGEEEEGAGGPGRSGRGTVGQSKGLIEPSLLVAANAGLGASVPLARLLPLWDYMLVRRDKHFGFFLLLAAILRRRHDLLAVSGTPLRRLLSAILSPEGIARAGLQGKRAETAEMDNDDGGAVADDDHGKEGSSDGERSALMLWCKEAEALDLNTPESFRHHLALIWEIAEAEHEAAMRARMRSDSLPRPAPADVPDAAVIASAEGGVTTEQPEADASGKGLNNMSLLRMRAMMKTAGDRLAADFKNLKLVRSASGSREPADDFAPPSELVLPQLCLAVGAKELISRLSRTGRKRVETGEEGGSEETGGGEVGAKQGVPGKKEAGGLFREREPLSFFAVDCRPKEQLAAGRLPTAYHLDPSSMENPEEMAETVTSVFEPLRGRVHLCLMGSGYGHLLAKGLSPRSDDGNNNGGLGGNSGALDSLKCARDEYSYVNTCALFLMKRGFPYVSVLDGGFAAAHELVVDTLRTDSNSLSADSIKAVLSPENTSEDSGLSTAIIVDHDAEAYRLGLAKNSSHGSSTSGGGGGGSMLSSPRIWARLGAADSSTHGEEVAKTDRANSRNSNKVQDPVTNAFFPPPHVAGSRRNSGPITADEITPQDAESSGGGSGCEGAATGGVSDPVGGGAASAGGGGGPGSSPVTEGLFKGAAMLRGINIDVTKINVNSMGVNMNNLWKGGKTPLPAADAGGDTPRAAAGVTVDAAADKEAATAAATPSSTEEDSSGGSGIASASASASVATSDLASKLRMSFGRFSARSSSSDSKAEAVEPAGGGGVGVGGEAGNSSSKRDSGGFGSLLRKAQYFKPADVAAAFADLRDGPSKSSPAASSSTAAAASAAATATASPSSELGSTGDAGTSSLGVEIEEEEDDEGEGLFVIGDDGSEASETPDSDFEGFDGEHRPPRTGGARSEADRAVALLEHRLSGQVKGATMVVDSFLKVPGAKIFTVTKHKVTYHDIDAGPADADAASSTSDKPRETADQQNESKDQGEELSAKATTESTAEPSPDAAETASDGSGSAETSIPKKDDAPEAVETSAPKGEEEAGGSSSDTEPNNCSESPPSPSSHSSSTRKKITVRAVTELERLVFLTRERILVLACPDGPTSPGLVKSNHHLTELQKMTFLRKDPTLVTLHYLAGISEESPEEVVAKTKRNVYRFDLHDKEAFIRIIRGALQRFQA